MRNSKLILLLIVLLLIILFTSQAAKAAEHALLIDNSGSVNGFYNTNAMRDLAAQLISTIENPRKILLFSEIVTELTEGIYSHQFQSNSDPNTNDTLIDNAFETAVNLGNIDIVWLVTDNIQDDSKTTGVRGNTEAFYRRLQSPQVINIYIFPPFLEFNGQLVDAPGNPHYQGRKGLLVYAILLNSTAEAEFKQKVEDFEQRVARFDSKCLFCKPLDQNTVSLTVPAPDEVSEWHSKHQESYEPPNIKEGEHGFHAEGFNTGKPVRGVFYVKFQSKFDDLKIDSKLEPGFTRFETVGFQETSVAPSIIPEELTLNPQEESATIYKITVQLPKVNIKKDLRSLLHIAFHRTGSLKGNVRADAVVHGADFKFRDEVLEKYHTDDISHPKKIYKMGALVEMMSTNVIRIPVVNAPLELAVEYPWWPFLLFLLVIAAFIASVSGLIWVLTRVEHITVNDAPASISLLKSYTVPVNNRPAARISKKFSEGMKVKPLGGFRVNERTTSQNIRPNSIFNITNDEGAYMDVNVQSRRSRTTDTDFGRGRSSRRGYTRRRPSRSRRGTDTNTGIDLDNL